MKNGVENIQTAGYNGARTVSIYSRTPEEMDADATLHLQFLLGNMYMGATNFFLVFFDVFLSTAKRHNFAG